MAVQTPASSITVGGVHTKGSPIDRPANTALRCKNFRIMPPSTPDRKPYLRLRGGKTIRYTGSGSESIKFIHEFRKATIDTPRYPLCQRYNSAGNMKWSAMALSSPPYTFGDLLDISLSYGFLNTQIAAVCNVREKVYLYNGLGVRNGTDSRPPFASWDGTTVRYVGLDAYCVGGNPTVAISGAGNNTIADLGASSGVSIYVGLHNTTTQHFSNAVFAGRLTTPTVDGEIVVSNLDRLKSTSNNATELAELRYVFYATYDGGAVAYLILNSSLDGPLTAAVSATTKSLSVGTTSDQGFVLDNTQERPTENNPPRPMSMVAYANGRVYGILSGNGSGTSGYLPDQPSPGSTDNTYYRDFAYVLTNAKDAGGIVWSASADQTTGNDYVGVPEESFPARNRKATPNGEYPTIIAETPGGQQILVVTNTGTFILSEIADGLHEWTTLSDTDGCAERRTFVRTPRGPMWVTQKSQLVLLNKDSLRLEVLSDGFDELLSGSAYNALGSAADYIRDPSNYLDCYKVWRQDTTAVVYDFNFGMAYEESGLSGITTAAGTVTDVLGQTHHIQASGSNVYSQEASPYTGLVSVRDELSSGVYTNPTGDYISQWIFRGDRLEQSRFTDLDVIGDGNAVTLTWYENLADTVQTGTLEKTRQSQTDLNYKFRGRTSNPFYLKIRLQLVGHYADLTTFTYPDSNSFTGELSPSDLANTYGCVYDVLLSLQPTGNRN